MKIVRRCREGLIALLFGLWQSASPVSAQQARAEWLPDRALVDHIESLLVMPPGAAPLDRYARYYTGSIAERRRMVQATFTLFLDAPGVHIVTQDRREQTNSIEDGGCGVLNLEFDVAADRVIRIVCNGQA